MFVFLSFRVALNHSPYLEILEGQYHIDALIPIPILVDKVERATLTLRIHIIHCISIFFIVFAKYNRRRHVDNVNQGSVCRAISMANILL